jgi:hypothetical protein
VADVQIGHRSATVCHLGNIARLLGRKLAWDPTSETFPGDDEANRPLDRPRRKPYVLPRCETAGIVAVLNYCRRLRAPGDGVPITWLA